MKVRKNKAQRYIFLLGTILLVLVIFFRFYNTKNTDSQPLNKEKSNSISCTRTTRLDNQPQYDRALSLLQQRINTNQDGRFANNPMHLFKSFPSQLVNCIKIVEETPANPDDFEGYFTFNGDQIKNNYYPVVVNSKYTESDDVLIALLLSHELTHVQQYIDSVNNKTSLSCVDKEVEAFLSQHRFFISVLNNEEQSTINYRIDAAVENSSRTGLAKLNSPFDGQLLMLQAIMDLRSNTTCEMRWSQLSGHSIQLPDEEYYKCVDSKVPNELKKIIEQDEHYKKQCDLK